MQSHFPPVQIMPKIVWHFGQVFTDIAAEIVSVFVTQERLPDIRIALSKDEENERERSQYLVRADPDRAVVSEMHMRGGVNSGAVQVWTEVIPYRRYSIFDTACGNVVLIFWAQLIMYVFICNPQFA